VIFADNAFPAALAAFFPVRACRPVCERALPAAVLAAVVAFGFLKTLAEAVAAFELVCLVFFLVGITE
jgi:hypothetical protein